MDILASCEKYRIIFFNGDLDEKHQLLERKTFTD